MKWKWGGEVGRLDRVIERLKSENEFLMGMLQRMLADTDKTERRLLDRIDDQAGEIDVLKIYRKQAKAAYKKRSAEWKGWRRGGGDDSGGGTPASP